MENLEVFEGFYGDLSNLAGAADGLDGNESVISGAGVESNHLDGESIKYYIDELYNMKLLMQNYYELIMQDCNLVYQMAEALESYDKKGI